MYNWVGVVDFLQKHFESSDLEKKEWSLEKHQLNKKISELEAHLAAGEAINIDLMKRIKVLEQCLVEERRARATGDEKEVSSVNAEAKITNELSKGNASKRNDEHLSFLEKYEYAY